MQIQILAPDLADLSAVAGEVWTWTPGVAGTLFVKQIFGIVEEAVAAGGFSSTTPVVDVQVEGTEVCTLTVDNTGGEAVGDSVSAVITSANVDSESGAVELSATDTVSINIKTQGAGGTVTGTLRLLLPFDINRG